MECCSFSNKNDGKGVEAVIVYAAKKSAIQRPQPLGVRLRNIYWVSTTTEPAVFHAFLSNLELFDHQGDEICLSA